MATIFRRIRFVCHNCFWLAMKRVGQYSKLIDRLYYVRFGGCGGAPMWRKIRFVFTAHTGPFICKLDGGRMP